MKAFWIGVIGALLTLTIAYFSYSTYDHLRRDHDFLHWLASEIGRAQASQKPAPPK